jgi:5-(carboxyamino)imidazole ribonucleotide synthase
MPATPISLPRHRPLSQPDGGASRIGIIGGGQLAVMTARAAQQLGCRVIVLEQNPPGPASRVLPEVVIGGWEDPVLLAEVASQVDVLTFENEFVDAGPLRALEAAGHAVFPTPACLALTQDKLRQKEVLTAAGLAVPRFRPVESPQELAAAGAQFGWPVILKTRRNGYDGKGNATVASAAEVPHAWSRLGGGPQALYVEAHFAFAKELAVIVTRGRNGEVATYPVVETCQRDHVCHTVLAPAAIAPELAARAEQTARRAVAAVDAVGSFGVEMFLSPAGDIVINELAPRVHNSGHYTIEACACSQFENHVRAILGWPLGSTQMFAPAAAMVNLLGTGAAPGKPCGLEHALGVPGARVHLYGKTMSGAGRKMGHVTVLADSAAAARAAAVDAAGRIRFTNR